MIHVCKNPEMGGGFHFLAHGLQTTERTAMGVRGRSDKFVKSVISLLDVPGVTMFPLKLHWDLLFL